MATIILGGNDIADCNGILLLNGTEVFRLRERSGDDQLVVDFEVRGSDGQLIVKVAKNNVVYARPGLKVRHEPKLSEVLNPSTGESIAKAEEVAPGVVSVTGKFEIDGCRIEATDAELVMPTGIRLARCGFRRLGQAISIWPDSVTIG